MAVRNRVYEVAKDLGVQSKDIIEILTEYSTGSKSNQQAMNESELNILFEALTWRNQNDNLTDMLEQAVKNPPPSPKKKEAVTLSPPDAENASEAQSASDSGAPSDGGSGEVERAVADGSAVQGGTRSPQGVQGGSRPAQGAQGGSRPSQGVQGGTRSPQGAQGGSRPSQGAQGGSRPAQGAQGGSRPAQGVQGGTRPSQGAQGGSRPSQGVQGGTRSPQGAQGGTRSPQGAQGGSRPSQGAQGGSRPSQGAQGGSRSPQGAQGGSRPAQGAKSAALSAVELEKQNAAIEAERNRRLLKFVTPAQAQSQKDRRKDQQSKQSQSQRSSQSQTLERNVPVVTGGVTLEQRSEDNSRKRVVDTRGATINIEKYDERLEGLVDERVTSKQGAGKQKIKKAKDRNAPTMAQGAKQRSQQRAFEQRRQLEQARRQVLTVEIPDTISVGELASRMKKTGAEVVKQLIRIGMFVSVSDTIDYETAALAALEMGCKVEREFKLTIEDQLFDETTDSDSDLTPRSPVVVVMGHVDHGKTSLLDKIRDANVAEGEAGGITQHIGAYQVEVNGKPITFLDTPGHEAFTSMRARGAMVTDIAILVVAADDGIMPQTVEAINHAKAAGIPIIVAINKMDKAGANPDRIMQQLTEHELVAEAWGGDTITVPISAKLGDGIPQLLEMVTLTAELRELRANPNRVARGTVIEARLDKGRGSIATLLVQNGTMRIGDVVIAGTAVGHVRTMTNSRGESLEEAGPSVPVEITGLAEVPGAGEIFSVVNDERMAKELADQRKFNSRQSDSAPAAKVTLDDLFSRIQEGELKELAIIVKADVQGSAEAVKASLEKLENSEVRVRVIHSGVGAVNESDVMLAATSNAIIVGFNIRPDAVTRDSAERQGVDMRLYRVIY
ncbi:MAG: translation initiation factor IF-2, partial [Oscillospiraceae bacterium]|nr:translation initiation factor IF-2 [Oscillospiraceae bacterium]